MEHSSTGRDKIIYIRDINNTLEHDEELNEIFSSGEPLRVEFEFASDQTIWELRVLFRRLALSLGYTAKSVDDAFPWVPEEDAKIEDLMDSEFSEFFASTQNLEEYDSLKANWQDGIENEIQKILKSKDGDEPNGDVDGA